MTCRIAIWRTFGRIQCHLIPEPRIILQGAATWWIHCHDSRATCHIAGYSHLAKSMSWLCDIAGCNDSMRHIENRFFAIFFVLMQFGLWRAAAFVSSPIHLFSTAEHDKPNCSLCVLSYHCTQSDKIKQFPEQNRTKSTCLYLRW